AYQTTTAPRLYPYDGATAVLGSQASGAANGTNLIALPSDVLGGTPFSESTGSRPKGLVFACLHAGVLLVRRFTGISSGTIFTVDDNWTTGEGVPASGDSYMIGIDLDDASELIIAGDASVSTSTARITAVVFDNGNSQTLAQQGDRLPWPIGDYQQPM